MNEYKKGIKREGLNSNSLSSKAQKEVVREQNSKEHEFE